MILLSDHKELLEHYHPLLFYSNLFVSMEAFLLSYARDHSHRVGLLFCNFQKAGHSIEISYIFDDFDKNLSFNNKQILFHSFFKGYRFKLYKFCQNLNRYYHIKLNILVFLNFQNIILFQKQ